MAKEDYRENAAEYLRLANEATNPSMRLRCSGWLSLGTGCPSGLAQRDGHHCPRAGRALRRASCVVNDRASGVVDSSFIPSLSNHQTV
jgi:hypothetical protein